MTTLPSSLLMGWEPAGVRSRIDKRRKPSATPGAKNVSPMSGPRWTMRSIMLVSTCSLFSTSPVNPTNPHIGHLSFVWHGIKADKSLKPEFYRACAPSRESSSKRLMPPPFARVRKRSTPRDRGNGRIGNRRSNWFRRDRGNDQDRQLPKPRALKSEQAHRKPECRAPPRMSTHAKGQHKLAFRLSLNDSSRGF